MSIQINLDGCGLKTEDLEIYRSEAEEMLKSLWNGEHFYTGWVHLPMNLSEEMIVSIEEVAEQIQKQSDYFIVLGVGGSYIGAKAMIDLLGNALAGTEVLFAGYHFSARYLSDLFQKIGDKDVSVCVISKSGTTAETVAAYGIFREYLIERYGMEEASRRTVFVTENRSNNLYDLAEDEGIRRFDLAEDIGGRYSVLTAVGLLPAAVAGIDIRRVVKGAAEIASQEYFEGEGLDYAITRQLFYQSGKNIEVFEFFDPYMEYFGEWLKQLFGESEGKDKKGIFPVSLLFNRDLHSMGQFLQQGTECFFETMIIAKEEEGQDVLIPETAIQPYAGKTMKQLNECAVNGVYDAHVTAGIPVIKIEVDRFDPEYVGQMFYFFETQCAVSALLSRVNPFDQPGVEAYKAEMRAYIQKLR